MFHLGCTDIGTDIGRGQPMISKLEFAMAEGVRQAWFAHGVANPRCLCGSRPVGVVAEMQILGTQEFAECRLIHVLGFLGNDTETAEGLVVLVVPRPDGSVPSRHRPTAEEFDSFCDKAPEFLVGTGDTGEWNDNTAADAKGSERVEESAGALMDDLFGLNVVALLEVSEDNDVELPAVMFFLLENAVNVDGGGLEG